MPFAPGFAGARQEKDDVGLVPPGAEHLGAGQDVVVPAAGSPCT